MKVLDVSIYDFSTFDAECFAANDVGRLIVGTSNYSAAKTMVTQARDAGIIVDDLYGFIYYGLGWESRDLDNCLALAAELGGIERIWLDCESGFSDNGVQDDTEAPGISVAYRVSKTWEQRRRVESAGITCGIYTGAFWWPSKMGNSPLFSDLPLWIANYGSNDPNNPRSPITEVSFGGWTTVAAHQYSSTIGLCGRPVRDNNYWFLEDSLNDRDILAIFGSTERDANGNLDYAARLAAAKARYEESIRTGHSPFDVAAQAIADAEAAKKLATAGGGGGGKVSPHTHTQPSTTGPVS